MPLQREHVQFAILFLSVPFQYFAVQYMGSSETSRTYAISQLVSTILYCAFRYFKGSAFKTKIFICYHSLYTYPYQVDEIHKLQHRWFRIEPWRNWCKNFLLRISENAGINAKPRDPTGSVFDPDDDRGESPALEVMKYRETQEFFGQSTIVRDPKPPNVKFRIGQVIKHKKWGYRGVVIAWDRTAKAPAEWLRQMHAGNKEWQNQPNYSILVDTRDRQAPRK